jgi:ankyrin repeat protein
MNFGFGKIIVVIFLFSFCANGYAQGKKSVPYKISNRQAYGLDTLEIDSLLHLGLDINAGYKDKVTLLDLAIYAGDYNEVKFLLHHGANIDQQNGFSSTPLMIATEKGLRNDSIAELLINSGADVNILSEFGEFALLNTLGFGFKDQPPNPKIFKMLVEHGANYNYVCHSCRERSLFIICCQYGTPEMLQVLINEKVDINQSDGDGMTGLMNACVEGNVENVRFLLKQPSIDLQKKDARSLGLIDYAVTGKNEEVIRMVSEAILKAGDTK